MASLLKRFYPDLMTGSAYEIPYDLLKKKGVQGVIYDIDNTLVEHGKPATDRAKRLFVRLHGMGMRTCLLSNNKLPRVKPFADAVHSPFLENAHKPSAASYKKACERMGLDPARVVFVGDQLFTDVFGANLAGIFTILVRPIHPKEEIQIILKRRLEAVVLFFYRRRLRRAGKVPGSVEWEKISLKKE